RPERVGTSPGGVIVVDRILPPGLFEEIADLVLLASPMIVRLAALEEAWANVDRLGQQSERFRVMVNSLPDPVVITTAANDIIVQNHRAERLLQVREEDSAGRRRAMELINLILENVADPILVTDERSNIILMNDQAELLFEDGGAVARNRREMQAIRGNDTKFTSFISEFALLDADSRRERMVLSNPRTGSD